MQVYRYCSTGYFINKVVSTLFIVFKTKTSVKKNYIKDLAVLVLHDFRVYLILRMHILTFGCGVYPVIH